MNTDPRSNDELNRIIAEWMGWTVWECKRGGYLLQYAYRPGSDPISGYRFDFREEAKKKYTQVTWNKVDPNKWAGEVPRYSSDLNAIHEAEEKLFPTHVSDLNGHDKVAQYRGILEWLCVGHPGGSFRATARQRAEALVKMIEEGKQQ